VQSDGSAMYTISGLWAQARENLNVTTVVYNNGAYDILRIELQRVGAGSAPGPKALDLLDLSRPTVDFAKIAEGHGGSGPPRQHRRGTRRCPARGLCRARTASHRRDRAINSGLAREGD